MNDSPIRPEQLKNMDRSTLGESLVESGKYTRFLVLHLPEWRPYFRDNAAELPKKEAVLIQGLDDESVAVVKRTLRSYTMILAAEDTVGKRIGRYDILVNPDVLLTDHEIELKRAAESGAPLLYEKRGSQYTHFERFLFPEGSQKTLDITQLRLCFGLKFIPPDMVDLRGKDVIDGGAYIGDSSLVFADFSPRKVYAFEPNPVALVSLRQTLFMNRRENEIDAVPMALGKTAGTFPFYTNESLDPGASLRVREEKSRIDVQCTSIDDFVQKNGLRPGLIKLDTEGSEFGTIQGAVKTIREFRPILLIAANHRPEDFFEIKPFIENLQLGYQIIMRDTALTQPNGEVSLIAFPDR